MLDVTSGNRHWCEEISHYIVERGVSEFWTEVNASVGTKRMTDGLQKFFLQSVVVGRMERLTTQQKVTLKYASLVGEEFSLSMLVAVLPSQLVNNCLQILEQLSSARFIYPNLNAGPTKVHMYGFGNKLLHEMIRGLTPVGYVYLATTFVISVSMYMCF